MVALLDEGEDGAPAVGEHAGLQQERGAGQQDSQDGQSVEGVGHETQDKGCGEDGQLEDLSGAHGTNVCGATTKRALLEVISPTNGSREGPGVASDTMEQPGMKVEAFSLDEDGAPVFFILDGQIWLVAPDAIRWFERRSWWETDLRMPALGGTARIDVEVWRLQARPEHGGAGGRLETFEIAATPEGARVIRSRTPEPDDDGSVEHPA